MSKPELPRELPAKPEGWTKRMTMHLNYGEDGGAGLYTILDADGQETGIVYQYDTRKPKAEIPAGPRRKAKPAFEPPKTGFHVPAADTEVFSSWATLHKAWPEIYAKATGAAGESGGTPV